jgi:hypothetical protein
MTTTIPYMLSPGVIPKILSKIQEARRPDRFTQDFLETKLGHGGGSARAIIPLLKRMGFLQSDGTPTDLYNKFRNAETQSAAMAIGIRQAYQELFDRNEYVYDLTREKLTSLVTEMTGLEKDNRASQAMVATFCQLKELANFEAELGSFTETEKLELPSSEIKQPSVDSPQPNIRPMPSDFGGVGMNIAYTINLNLPETTNPDVFNAIFKALKENLLAK